MEPKKVFIITTGEYSDYQIECVFDTKELAEEHLPNFAKFGARIEDYILYTKEDIDNDR